MESLPSMENFENIKLNDNIYVNHWSEDKESLLKQWSLESELYSWLHNYNADFYEKLDYFVSIPAIFISAITSTALFSTLNKDDNQYVIIIFGILLAISTFLQSFRDFVKINKLHHDNRHYSKLYKIMLNDIDSQLNQDMDERENGKTYLEKIKNKRNSMTINAPSITNKSWKKLEESLKNGKYLRLKNKRRFYELLCDQKQTLLNIDKSGALSNYTYTNNNQLNINIDDIKKKIFFINE